jgi:hypothetical protein
MEAKLPEFNIKRCVFNGQSVDILDYESYGKNPELARTAPSSTVIEATTESGKNIVLPYKGKRPASESVPGVYDYGPMDIIIMPKEEFENDYIPNDVVIFNSKDGIKNIQDKQEKLAKLTEPWIVNSDNITVVGIEDTNQPEMVGLKTAINEKQIDLDKYASRFGDNFPNDKRQLKNDSLTLKILKRFCTNLDIEAELVFRDKNPNVPNPINREIVVSLTENYEDDEEG